MTRQFAVVGNPIEHSRSPELHQAFAQSTGINLVYSKRLAPLNGFADNIRAFFASGGTGLNVTVPFKEQAYCLCDVLSPRAQAARAVNTLWQQDGKLYGDNTDGQGLVDALHALGWNLKQARILILGAGGATRGVMLPLAQAGASHIVIANRTLNRAQQLIDDLQPLITNTQLDATGLEQLSGEFDLVINATSASLSGDALILPKALIFHHAYEMAYGKPSSFLEQATARGVPNSDGFSMLVGQAIEAFFIWNGVKPALEDFLKLQ
ncbi:shikimate dehydrogenase [Alkanindiges sp. WGS2144]|uniref:shikimate dehydrogenase n=1 Tax=Alkanindiges sp. WGS2144 TaxID=3366808 RepID=UPI0037522F0C